MTKNICGILLPTSVTIALGLAMTFFSGCTANSDIDNGKATDSMQHHGTAGHEHGGHDHDATPGKTNGHAQTTRLEFVSEPSSMPVGTPVTWTLKVLDAKSGEPVQEFATVHEKLMHLIIVSADLSWFNHIHPEYAGNGTFTVKATLPRPGSYKLYADYTPKGGIQEVPQHEFATGGEQPTPTMILPVVDTVGSGGWIEHATVGRPEGKPEAKGGASYQVALMPMPAQFTAGKDAMLHFQVRDVSGKPISDLEPYLGAMGHVVILSSDTKNFLHAHPMDGEMEGMNHGDMKHQTNEPGKTVKGTGPDVIFHTDFPAPGIYKAWAQFQHKGKIITAPFVLRVS